MANSYSEIPSPDIGQLKNPTVQLSASELDAKRLNIWLVEDVNADAVFTKTVLEATGVPFDFTCIERGDSLISRLKVTQPDSPPDIIFLDMGLPGMDGFEILTEMLRLPVFVRSIPIVILTGHSYFEDVSTTYPLNIVDYIVKFPDTERLKNILQRIRHPVANHIG